jgi:hypothetical protein
MSSRSTGKVDEQPFLCGLVGQWDLSQSKGAESSGYRVAVSFNQYYRPTLSREFLRFPKLRLMNIPGEVEPLVRSVPRLPGESSHLESTSNVSHD